MSSPSVSSNCMKTSSSVAGTTIRWVIETPAAFSRPGRRAVGPSAYRTRKCRYPPNECTSSTSGSWTATSLAAICGSAASSRYTSRKAGHQLARFTLDQRAAVIHKDDAIEAHRFVHVRRADQNGRSAAQQADQQVPEFLAGHRVHAAGRFIQQEHFGAMHQGRRQSKFLLHTAG